MRTWILRVLPKFTRRTRRSAPTTYRPTLEQLEDRCVPSANMMPSMGMTMQPTMNMQSMSMQTTSMTGMNMMNNGLSPATIAAISHLITDFSQTEQKVMSSQSFPQFVANEMNMITVLQTDIANVESTLNGMG